MNLPDEILEKIYSYYVDINSLPNETIHSLPNEILEKIYYNYVDIYQHKMKTVHNELLSDNIFLIISEHIYEWDLDYCYATRIPRLLDIF